MKLSGRSHFLLFGAAQRAARHSQHLSAQFRANLMMSQRTLNAFERIPRASVRYSLSRAATSAESETERETEREGEAETGARAENNGRRQLIFAPTAMVPWLPPLIIIDSDAAAGPRAKRSQSSRARSGTRPFSSAYRVRIEWIFCAFAAMAPVILLALATRLPMADRCSSRRSHRICSPIGAKQRAAEPSENRRAGPHDAC